MLRGAWALLVFLVATPCIAGGALVASLVRRREVDLRPAALWSRAMLRAVGAEVEYLDVGHAATEGSCVFAANHQSNVDIWAVIPALPRQTKFVVKQSLFRIPLLGGAMRRAGFVSIDRSDRKRAIESLRVAAELIRNGRPVIVFPEGTRSRDGSLAAFKKGSFHLALQAGVPIVPVAISGSWRVLPPGLWRVRPGPVRVRFLDPIRTSGVGSGSSPDVEALRERTRDAIARALETDLAPAVPAERIATVS